MRLLLDRLEDAASIPNEILRAIPKYWDSQEKISKYIRNEWESWERNRNGGIQLEGSKDAMNQCRGASVHCQQSRRARRAIDFSTMT